MVYNTKYDVVYKALKPNVSHNFLSNEEIEKIINDKKHDWHKGRVINDVGGGVIESSVRNVEKTHLNNCDWLSNRIYKHIKKVIKNSDWPDINVTRLSHIELLKYRGGGKYLWHNDLDYGDSHIQRKFTAVIALNDRDVDYESVHANARDVDYTGGILKISNFSSIYQVGDKNYLKKGSIVVFPSYMDHIVTPVTSGTRYSIVAWGEGPYWR